MSTETEIELGKVVVFQRRITTRRMGLLFQREGKKALRSVTPPFGWNEKERTYAVWKCETLIEPFDFLMTPCDRSPSIMESGNISRREEKQRRRQKYRKTHSD